MGEQSDERKRERMKERHSEQKIGIYKLMEKTEKGKNGREK